MGKEHEGAYSAIHLQIYGFNYYYKDYSGRTPEDILDDWAHRATVHSFAGDNSERIDAGDFAAFEQMITEVPDLDNPDQSDQEWLEEEKEAARGYRETLIFSAHIDVDHNRFRVHGKDETDITLSEALAGRVDERIRVFVDMDGTLAKFQNVDTLETLYEEGYFLNLPPQPAVVEAVKRLADDPRVEVFILSSALSDSKYALTEKQAWLDRYLPEIDWMHRIFPPCGEDKKMHIPDGIRTTDCLLDDYTRNLSRWEPPAKGIKLLNGINHTKGTWQGAMVSHELAGEKLYQELVARILPTPTEERKGRGR